MAHPNPGKGLNDVVVFAQEYVVFFHGFFEDLKIFYFVFGYENHLVQDIAGGGGAHGQAVEVEGDLVEGFLLEAGELAPRDNAFCGQDSVADFAFYFGNDHAVGKVHGAFEEGAFFEEHGDVKPNPGEAQVFGFCGKNHPVLEGYLTGKIDFLAVDISDDGVADFFGPLHQEKGFCAVHAFSDYFCFKGAGPSFVYKAGHGTLCRYDFAHALIVTGSACHNEFRFQPANNFDGEPFGIGIKHVGIDLGRLPDIQKTFYFVTGDNVG